MRLNFHDVESQIQTGDVLLFRGRSVFARLIRWYTSSEYTHAGVVLRIRVNGHTYVAVIEALEPFGCRVYPLAAYLERNESIDWFQIHDYTINRDKVAGKAIESWGRASYAWRQLWWSFSKTAWLIRKVFRLGKVVGCPTDAYCSQYVARCLAAGGYLDAEFDADATPPGVLARFVCLQLRGTFLPMEPSDSASGPKQRETMQVKRGDK